jgi:hypothetical protein
VGGSRTRGVRRRGARRGGGGIVRAGAGVCTCSHLGSRAGGRMRRSAAAAGQWGGVRVRAMEESGGPGWIRWSGRGRRRLTAKESRSGLGGWRWGAGTRGVHRESGVARYSGPGARRMGRRAGAGHSTLNTAQRDGASGWWCCSGSCRTPRGRGSCLARR